MPTTSPLSRSTFLDTRPYLYLIFDPQTHPTYLFVRLNVGHLRSIWVFKFLTILLFLIKCGSCRNRLFEPRVLGFCPPYFVLLHRSTKCFVFVTCVTLVVLYSISVINFKSKKINNKHYRSTAVFIEPQPWLSF